MVLTDGADDAGHANLRGVRVDVQGTEVLQAGVGVGRMELLALEVVLALVLHVFHVKLVEGGSGGGGADDDVVVGGGDDNGGGVGGGDDDGGSGGGYNNDGGGGGGDDGGGVGGDDDSGGGAGAGKDDDSGGGDGGEYDDGSGSGDGGDDEWWWCWPQTVSFLFYERCCWGYLTKPMMVSILL